MKANPAWLLVPFLVILSLLSIPRESTAQVPGILNYQGRVAVGGTNYDGTGQFKFSLVDGSGVVTFWSNGTASVAVPVSKGLYSVLLGDTALANMASIPAGVFTNSDIRLRVWLDTGGGLQLLTPDQRIAAAGYALWSAGVLSAGDIVGRRLNLGPSHTLRGSYSSIAGGFSNLVQTASDYSNVGGGVCNSLQSNTPVSVIGGGFGNSVSSSNAVIAGGYANRIATNASCSTVGGGGSNEIQGLATHSTIAGGFSNKVGYDATESVIGGGMNNRIGDEAGNSTIGGGTGNSIQDYSYSSFLGGGLNNAVQLASPNGVLVGGYQNIIQTNAGYSALGGGQENTIWTDSSYATLGGGYQNTIQPNAIYATICGGENNSVSSNAGGAVVGGGYMNTAGGGFSVVPGGTLNTALGAKSLAAGSRAKAMHDGSFVWGDSTAADIASTAANQFIIRVAGGVGVNTGNPGAGVDIAAKTNSHGLRVQGVANAGGTENAVVRIVNQNTTGDSLPALRVVGQGGDASGGALSVSQNGTGYIAYFGNASSWVSTLSTNGTWTGLAFNSTSDRHAKQEFKPVDSRDILDRVVAMPIQTWSFKIDGDTRHIGPMAQDFHAAFQVGTDERHIATVDADGVALAAIQGLYGVVREKESRIATLERELKELKEQVKRLSD